MVLTVRSGGGETADVDDLTNTILVDSYTTVIVDRSTIIDASNIRLGLSIIGLASLGKASYEDIDNSGIGSNGFTSARHNLLSSYCKKRYSETFDQTIPTELVYSGDYLLEDRLLGSLT